MKIQFPLKIALESVNCIDIMDNARTFLTMHKTIMNMIVNVYSNAALFTILSALEYPQM